MCSSNRVSSDGSGVRRRSAAPSHPGAPGPAQRSLMVLWLGLGLLAAACGFSGALALHHLSGLCLPGCGAGCGGVVAARCVWGRVPGVDWPTSFLGLAYFLG